MVHAQSSTNGSLPLPLDRISWLSFILIAERLYSILKYHFLRRGGREVGSDLRRSLQLLRLEKKDWTQASAV